MVAMRKLARPLMRGVVVEINGTGPKNVSNKMVRDILTGLPQFKGEIVVGKPIDPDCHEMTKLFLESEDVLCPFIYWVYDLKTTGIYDLERRLKLTEQLVYTTSPCIQYVDHTLIENEAQLSLYMKEVMEGNHFPGVVLREPWGTYGTEDQTLTEETGALQ